MGKNLIEIAGLAIFFFVIGVALALGSLVVFHFANPNRGRDCTTIEDLGRTADGLTITRINSIHCPD